jgi:adenylate cyclase
VTLQTPAIVDLRAGRTDTSSKIPAWLRGVGVRQVRLTCGLVMFSYIFSHFFNHALGNISYPAMEWWLSHVHVAWWRIPLVNYTLYAAAVTHMSLGLWALYQRRHFRFTAAEVTQLVLGLSIPLLLARVSTIFGQPVVNYATPLFGYWKVAPYKVAVQFVLLTVAWTHACIGLYFWLRMKAFFKWAGPILLAIAVLLPPLAMIGAHHAAGEVIALAKDPQWRRQNLHSPPPRIRKLADEIATVYFPIAYLSAIALVFVARGIRSLRERRGGMITISYPDRQIRVPKGLSVLEASACATRFHMPASAAAARAARPAAFAF